MEEGSIAVLVDAKEEYTKQLINIFKPYIYQGIKSIYGDSKKISDDKNTPDEILMIFQDLLSRIPKWSQEIIDKEYQRIVEASSCDWIEDLLKVVYISHIKILTIVHKAQPNKKINLKVPTGQHFMHLCYIEVAREFWKNPYLLSDSVSKYEYQRNMRESEMIINECIGETVRKQLPVKHILKEYLGEYEESDNEEEDIKNPIDKKYLKKLQTVVKKELRKNGNTNIELEDNIRRVLQEELGKMMDVEEDNDLENGDSDSDLDSEDLELDDLNELESVNIIENVNDNHEVTNDSKEVVNVPQVLEVQPVNEEQKSDIKEVVDEVKEVVEEVKEVVEEGKEVVEEGKEVVEEGKEVVEVPQVLEVQPVSEEQTDEVKRVVDEVKEVVDEVKEVVEVPQVLEVQPVSEEQTEGVKEVVDDVKEVVEVPQVLEVQPIGETKIDDVNDANDANDANDVVNDVNDISMEDSGNLDELLKDDQLLLNNAESIEDIDDDDSQSNSELKIDDIDEINLELDELDDLNNIDELQDVALDTKNEEKKEFNFF
jgi:hypothetical protein